MTAQLESERKQLLDHWEKRLKKNPDWMEKQLRQVCRAHAASRGDEKAEESLPSQLRQLHDKFGFKAKGSLSSGGLCAGTIFRTERFMKTAFRDGSKKAEKTVHIEHTVPIKRLSNEICKSEFSSYNETLTWLLTHSVATAFHESEKLHLVGRTSSSGAFDLVSIEHQRPFARYAALYDSGGAVWNVLDRERVDPETFTFSDHIQIFMRLLQEVGASPSMRSSIWQEHGTMARAQASQPNIPFATSGGASCQV